MKKTSLPKKTQRVSFRFLDCAGGTDYSVDVSENHRVRLALFDVIMQSFSIFKQGPDTEHDFIESKVKRTSPYEGRCEITKIRPGVWAIIDDLSPEATYSTTPCGSYGRDSAGLKYFFFKDGIVVNTHLINEGLEIDLRSITYENKG